MKMSETCLDAGTQLRVVEALRKRLGERERWTQYASARDGAGEACGPCRPNAEKWCLSGAVYRELEDLHGRPGPGRSCETTVLAEWYWTIAELLESAIPRGLTKRCAFEIAQGGDPIEVFNDTHDWKDVVDVIDEALGELEEQRGKRR